MTLILSAMLLILATLYIWDTVRYMDSLRKYAGMLSEKNRELLAESAINSQLLKDNEIKSMELTSALQQIESMGNANQLLSADLDKSQKETEKLREFNTILQMEYNKVKKQTKGE
ncbi:MAG: hypothetical protein IKB71_11830 [Lentisphaeria bacterium]|nr:hypothetical protein [Lentisphaeria bacterium]